MIRAEKPPVEDGLRLFMLAHETALKWFEIHADQRLKLIRFYMIAIGFCVAGFAAALQTEIPLVASMIALLMICFSLCFKMLDRRTAQLVKHAEDYLKISGSRLAIELSEPAANLAELAEQKLGIPSYRQTFGVMFWLIGLFGLLGIFIPWIA